MSIFFVRSCILIPILYFLLGVSSIAWGQETQPEQQESAFAPRIFSFTSTFRSKYVLNADFVPSDKPVIQSDLFIGTPSGLWLDVWGSVPVSLSRTGEDGATEEAITLGWTGKLHGFNLTFAVVYDDLCPNFSIDGRDLIFLVAEVSHPFEITKEFTVEPFIHVESNFSVNGAVRGTPQPRIGSKYAWQMTDTLSLSGKLQLMYDPGILGGDEAWIGSIESSLNWKLGKSLSLEFPFVRFITPLTSVNDGRKLEIVYGAGFSLNF